MMKLLLTLAMLLTPVAEIFYFSQWNHMNMLIWVTVCVVTYVKKHVNVVSVVLKTVHFVSLQSMASFSVAEDICELN